MTTQTNFTYQAGDGAKWGVSDFYDNFDVELRRALASNKDFDTGYYGVKKEIESGRISRRDGTIYVEVIVSDDFDTEGHGESSVPASALVGKSIDEQIEAIKQALDEACDRAGMNQLDNKVVEIYCVGRDKDGYSAWTFTYLRDVSGHGFEQPPGDSYHRWGWQDVDTEDDSDIEAFPQEIGAEVAKQIENAIHDGAVDDAGKDGVVIEGWRVKVG